MASVPLAAGIGEAWALHLSQLCGYNIFMSFHVISHYPPLFSFKSWGWGEVKKPSVHKRQQETPESSTLALFPSPSIHRGGGNSNKNGGHSKWCGQAEEGLVILFGEKSHGHTGLPAKPQCLERPLLLSSCRLDLTTLQTEKFGAAKVPWLRGQGKIIL